MSLYICPSTWNVLLRGNPKVNPGLWVIGMCHCWFIKVTNAPLWWGVLVMGEAVDTGRRHMGNLYLLLNSAVKLKLL